MSRTEWGYAYWGAGWLLLGFLVAELLGFFRVAPWPTFSETVWAAERHEFVGPLVFAGLIGLIAHFLFHRPLWASLLFGLLVAFAAHIADRAWP